MDQQGRTAASPWAMPWPAWRQVLGRTWAESSKDNLGLIAGGIAFSGFLAIVPILGALVLSYGLFAEPRTVVEDVNRLAGMMPREAAKLIEDQLLGVVSASDGKKGFALALALALALFSARSGAGAVITALNIAYEEEETRSVLRTNALAIAITAGGVLVALLATVAVTVLGRLETLLPALPDWTLPIWSVLSYAAMAAAGAGAAATLYRFGPARAQAKWVWLTPGSLLAALLWLLLTIGFGVYVANFGNYGATYGSLSAVVVLLTWLYLSAYVLLFGAELNSEFEHQTAADTTTGAARPLGARQAWVADHVAGGAASDGPGGPGTPSPPPPAAPLAPMLPHAPRVAVRVARAVALREVGVAPALVAAGGLALLRRGRAPAGAAALAAAGGLAWLTRRRPRLRAVLFDIDGTLVDSNGLHVAAWAQAFREHGHDVPPDRIAGQIGKGGDQLVPALVPNLPESARKALAERHGAIFKARYLGQVRPFPGAADLLRRTAASGRAVVLASSASQEEADHYLDLLGVRDVVTATTSADDVARSKPAGDIFAAALKKANVRAGEAIAVGDTPYDVSAAAKAGIRTVAVRSGGFSDDDLAGAVAIYDDAAALLRRWRASALA